MVAPFEPMVIHANAVGMTMQWRYVEHDEGARIAQHDRLISYFGYDGSGSAKRYPHVALVPGGTSPRMANIYAEAQLAEPAPLPTRR